MAAAFSVAHRHAANHSSIRHSSCAPEDDDGDEDKMPTGPDIVLDLVVRRRCMSAAGVLWQKRRAVITHDSIKFSKLPPENDVLDDVALLDIQSVEMHSGLSQVQEQSQLQPLRVTFFGTHTKTLLACASDTLSTTILDAEMSSGFVFDSRRHMVLYEGVELEPTVTLEEHGLPVGATVAVEMREDSVFSGDSDDVYKKGWIYKKGQVRQASWCPLPACACVETSLRVSDIGI